MKRLLGLGFAVLLTSHRGFADGEIKWGQSANGLRIGIESPAASVTEGQMPTFTVTAQNVSPQPITLPTPDTFLLRNTSVDEVHATPLSPIINDTQTFPPTSQLPDNGTTNTGPTVESLHPHVVTLAPGESVTWKDVPLERHYYEETLLTSNRQTGVEKYPMRPDTSYRIRFHFENDQAQVANVAAWTGGVESGTVDLQIKPMSADGIKVDGGFSLPKQTYFVGEPIEATFSVTNKGSVPISFMTGGDYRGSGRHDRFSIRAVDSFLWRSFDPLEGKPLNGAAGGIGTDPQLKPGESYTENLLVNDWCAFSKPGKYWITCKRTLNVTLANDQGPDAYPVRETGLPAIPIETTLEVTLENNPAARATYIASLIPDVLKLGAPFGDSSEQLRSLAWAQAPDAFPEIVKILDAPEEIQSEGIDWLSYYGGEKAAPVFFEHWSKLKPRAQDAALDQLTKWNATGVEPLVAATLRNPDHDLRAHAVLLCSRKDYPSCLPILLGMGDDPDPKVRQCLAAALGASGDERAVPVLLKLLQDSDPSTEIWAATGLGNFKHMEGVPVMIHLLNGTDELQEDYIMEALKNLTGQDFDDNPNAYLDWWKKTGRAQYDKP